ncbi:HAD family hydrolase [Allosphingosinicella deserti]|uniref:hypothetical protein n=1 Tax=Allosphingosinicella deserti TaxID=2116704 RepID=UPI001E322A3A|nr:hypothetical protein [Sphingomonas deserti]
MRPIALVDLDDTLFQTLRKCPPGMPHEVLTPLGFARDGSALSYATPRQVAFLSWLSTTALLVPVTARSRNALDRVRIEWRYAVCAHGGVVIHQDGRHDPIWAERMATEAAAYRTALDGLTRRAEREAGPVPLSIRVVEEDGTPLYLLLKHQEADADALAAAVARIAPDVPAGWTVHVNGNNAAFMPPFLGKQHAVEWLLPTLRRESPDAPTIGIGDSITDAPFMRLCDFAMTPPGSQLAGQILARAA